MIIVRPHYICGLQSSVFFLMPVKFAILYTLANLLFIGRYALTKCITQVMRLQAQLVWASPGNADKMHDNAAPCS